VTLRSNLTKEQFESDVRTAKEHIAAGDIYQVVLSQRFEADVTADPFTVYRALRHVNPSPYMYFLRLGKLAIVGASPEMLVRVEGRRAQTHPIAGTRPRGATTDEDQRLAEELKRNEKERAEHVMLVDLGRNDLSRACVAGSVRVERFMDVERFSHVTHLVSEVVGELRPGVTPFELLRDCFPAGTVTGAPKIRAMQLIAELEDYRRGPYAGAVGYVLPGGTMDTCIALRTIVWIGEPASAGGSRSEPRSATYDVQAGAGVVADSVPALEWEETMNKAKALLKEAGADGMTLHEGTSARSPLTRKNRAIGERGCSRARSFRPPTSAAPIAASANVIRNAFTANGTKGKRSGVGAPSSAPARTGRWTRFPRKPSGSFFGST
jgi:anthranilate synthase component 1